MVTHVVRHLLTPDALAPRDGAGDALAADRRGQPTHAGTTETAPTV
jgi:hypothetical protein